MTWLCEVYDRWVVVASPNSEGEIGSKKPASSTLAWKLAINSIFIRAEDSDNATMLITDVDRKICNVVSNAMCTRNDLMIS